MTSRAYKASRVYTNEGAHKIFEQLYIKDSELYPGGRFDFNGASLGDATVDEIESADACLPNVQAAIMQLALAAILPVGSILQSTDASNPFNSSQFSETITFEGISNTEAIELYGVPVQLEIGDSNNEVAEKVFNAIHASAIFDTVPEDYVAPSNSFILKHKSSRPHHTQYSSTLTDIVDDAGESTGIQAKSVVSGKSPGETTLGYGTWELFYTDSSTYSVPVYHYRRIA